MSVREGQRLLACVLATVVACSGTPSAESEGVRAIPPQSPPRFEEFAAEAIFRGAPAPIDLSGETARRFRTRLSAARAEGANFAGRFALVTWGCGTACLSGALLDLRSGAVHPLPIAPELGLDFRADSRLLIVHPPAEIAEQYPPGSERPARVRSEYYVWSDSTSGWTLRATIYPPPASSAR